LVTAKGVDGRGRDEIGDWSAIQWGKVVVVGVEGME